MRTVPDLPPFAPDFRTRHVFFTGKGGVGKTTLSCATAVALAGQGKRVLLLSTDPASNLAEVLQTELTSEPKPVPGAGGLHALNLDPMAAAAEYRARVLDPVRGLLPPAVLARMEEELSGACTVEIAAFDAFTDWMNEAGEKWDHLVFDTAPTGHTLRLMGLARAWDHFLATNTTGNSCLGPLAGLGKQKARYEATLKALADGEATTLVLVARPDGAALAEAERTSGELRDLGITNQQLVLNAYWRAPTGGDKAAEALAAQQAGAMRRAGNFLSGLPVFHTPMRAAPVLGLTGLRAMLAGDGGEPAAVNDDDDEGTARHDDIGRWLGEISTRGQGVILTMGKGGVGKTTIASAIALDLARRGHRVHLTTTDPANHLRAGLASAESNLTIGSIEPASVTKAYRREVLANAGAVLDEAGRALLEEDLRSPCTEEIAVFRAFAREVARGEDGFVIVDTAPTGHTLLLLDASLAYHRETERLAPHQVPDEVARLLPRLRDPEFCHVLILTLPEPTPVHEASALQDDLRRAGIEPSAWVVNQSLGGLESSHPILRGRKAAERICLREVAGGLARRVHLLPWSAVPPETADDFLSLVHGKPSSD